MHIFYYVCFTVIVSESATCALGIHYYYKGTYLLIKAYQSCLTFKYNSYVVCIVCVL